MVRARKPKPSRLVPSWPGGIILWNILERRTSEMRFPFIETSIRAVASLIEG